MHVTNERAIEKAQRSRTFFVSLCRYSFFLPIWTESRLEKLLQTTRLNLLFRFSVSFAIFLLFCLFVSLLLICSFCFPLLCNIVYCGRWAGGNSRMCTIKLEIEKIHCKGKNQAWNWTLKTTKPTFTTMTTTIAVCSLQYAHAAHLQCELSVSS